MRIMDLSSDVCSSDLDTVMPEVQNAVPGTSDEEPEGQAAAASATLLSHETAAASRHSLAALSALIIRADDAPSNTLEGLIRDMLRPMLREWLDANLPELVQKMVARSEEHTSELQSLMRISYAVFCLKK